MELEGNTHEEGTSNRISLIQRIVRAIRGSWYWLLDKPERLTALSTLLIFIATAVAAIVGIAQWRVLRGQLNEMVGSGIDSHTLVESNKSLAKAAMISAEAAKRSADIAETGVRAWIAPMRFAFVNLNDPKQPLNVRLFYQNVGREPATKVRNWVELDFMSLNFRSSQWTNINNWKVGFGPTQMCDQISSENTSVLYPSSTVGASIDVPTRPWFNSLPDIEILSRLSEVKNQNTALVIKGCFEYETIHRLRHAVFCSILIPIQGKSIEEWQFSACPVGNDDY